MSSRYDVAVIGGGPAGLTAAVALRNSGRSVVVIDRISRGRRVGETLVPDVRHLLASLSLTEGFDDIPSVSFVGTRSTWGSASEPFERSSILNPLGAGLHVDRAVFDQWFVEQASRCGVCVEKVSERVDLKECSAGWSMSCGALEFEAPFLIDARGRSVAEGVPRRWVAFDRLVGLVGWFSGSHNTEPELLIEPIECGWWYSAPQPDGGLVATLMTDADLLSASADGKLLDYWTASLDLAPLTRERLNQCSQANELEVRRAESGYSYPDRGGNWRAVGDAAISCDPLAGVGIANAIRSGIAAAQEIDSPSTPAAPPLDYLEKRAQYYGMETRWPSPFWLRRQPVSLDNFQVFLDPNAMLMTADREVSLQEMAKCEAFLPPRAIRDLFSRMKTETRAHEALALLKDSCGPLGDTRLLAGLQLMIMSGAVSATSSL